MVDTSCRNLFDICLLMYLSLVLVDGVICYSIDGKGDWGTEETREGGSGEKSFDKMV